MDGFPVSVPIRVQWGDQDALGHVNNTRHFAWFESARVELFERIACRVALGAEEGPILAATSCEYLAPIHYPAELLVGARIARTGRTSIHFEHAIARADRPSEPVARGTAVVVMVSYRSGQPLPLPDGMRKALEQL